MKKYGITLMGIGLLLVIIATGFLVTSGFMPFQKKSADWPPERRGDIVTSPFDNHQARLSLFIPSPDRNAFLVGRNCQETGNPHAHPFCDVRLEQLGQDGKRQVSDWVIPQVVYGMWSADGSRFAVDTSEHQIFVGDRIQSPVALEGRFSAPALSPSGKQVAMVTLGEGEDIFEQGNSSPGITVRDLVNQEQKVVVLKHVYAPFFIDETRLGYESEDEDKPIGLYMIDMKTASVTLLINRQTDPQSLAALSALPIIAENGTLIVFTSPVNDKDEVFALSLVDLSVKPRPDLKGPDFRDNEVIREEL